MYETKVDSRAALHHVFLQWQSMYTTIQPTLRQPFSLLMHATKCIVTGGGHFEQLLWQKQFNTDKGTKTHSCYISTSVPLDIHKALVTCKGWLYEISASFSSLLNVFRSIRCYVDIYIQVLTFQRYKFLLVLVCIWFSVSVLQLSFFHTSFAIMSVTVKLKIRVFLVISV
jgi:hypothetical protein